MIKILFFIESLTGGGAEKVLTTLVNHMDQEKFDITVQTVFPDARAGELREGIRYKSMYKRKNPFMQRVFRLEAALGLAYPLHIKGDYELEVAYLECVTTKLLAQSTNKKAKKLAWVHCDLVKAFGKAFAIKTKTWYEKFDKVVCVSERVAESVKELYGKEIDTEIIYNTIDSDEIKRKSLEPVTDIKKQKKTVLFVGRLSRPKNLLRLLGAHERLRRDGIDHELWIVGDGEEKNAANAFIKEHHLEDTVRMLGYKSNPYAYMRAADIIACSSDYEGFSTFITEALILGKPIVTTDVSGMRELLGDSHYGSITPVNDEGFYQGLKEMLLLHDRELEDKALCAAARGNMFDTKQLVKRNEDFFINLQMGEGVNG